MVAGAKKGEAKMKLGRAILIRLGLGARNEPDAFDRRLELLTSATPVRRRSHGVFRNRASHLAA